MVVVYDPCRHQGTTPWHKRSRHPRVSSPHGKRRRRMPTFATLLEDFVSLWSTTLRARAHGPIFPFWTFLEQSLERKFTPFFLQMSTRVCGEVPSSLIEPKMSPPSSSPPPPPPPPPPHAHVPLPLLPPLLPPPLDTFVAVVALRRRSPCAAPATPARYPAAPDNMLIRHDNTWLLMHIKA